MAYLHLLYCGKTNLFPHKNKNEFFFRMATPKNASFTELIFADHEFSTHFCGINFFGANLQKLIPLKVITIYQYKNIGNGFNKFFVIIFYLIVNDMQHNYMTELISLGYS